MLTEKENTQFFTGLLIFAILSLVGAFLTYQSRQKIKKSYNELEFTKNLLQKKTEELNWSHRELNHRVKNNLHLVSSLIHLQEDEVKDEKSREVFDNLASQIDTIKIVHNKLYKNKQNEQLTKVAISDYVGELAESIMDDEVNLNLQVEPIIIEMDHATDIGLIINELITNANKYAFPKTINPELCIDISLKQKYLFISIKDNGPGFPSGFSIEKANSFGLKSIVESLVFKSNLAKLQFFNKDGANVLISMPFNQEKGVLIS